jgi:hypothetical protein
VGYGAPPGNRRKETVCKARASRRINISPARVCLTCRADRYRSR